jgi:hypothetical protein
MKHIYASADMARRSVTAPPSAGTNGIYRFAGYQQDVWDSPAPASPRWHPEGDKRSLRLCRKIQPGNDLWSGSAIIEKKPSVVVSL